MPIINQDDKNYFVVTYRDPESVPEQKGPKNITLKVKNIEDSRLGLSFVRFSGFMFETAGMIVDPIQENLRKRFEYKKALHLSIYSIISIEEVGSGPPALQFIKDKSNLLVLSGEGDDRHF